MVPSGQVKMSCRMALHSCTIQMPGRKREGFEGLEGGAGGWGGLGRQLGHLAASSRGSLHGAIWASGDVLQDSSALLLQLGLSGGIEAGDVALAQHTLPGLVLGQPKGPVVAALLQRLKPIPGLFTLPDLPPQAQPAR